MERTIDGMINIKATFAAVLHSSLHFDVFKLASDLCWIPYVLCVCYRLSLILDGFINDLHKQGTFWFNGCLNASFIICILFGVRLLFEATKQSIAIWTIGIIIWRCNIC